MKFCWLLLAVVTTSLTVLAQPNNRGVLIYGGTIHTGDGQIINNGLIAFEKGKIYQLDSITGPEKGYTGGKNSIIINAKGKHIYPGLIAPATYLGLNEIDAVRATRDYDEAGDINPNVRSLIAYNTDSKIIPTVRSNGILLAQVQPRGGLVSGTSSIMKLVGHNWEDAVLQADDGLHINWPASWRSSGWWAQPGNNRKQRTQQRIQKLNTLFTDAVVYSEAPTTPNLKLAAIGEVLQGKRQLFIHVQLAADIVASVKFAQQYGIIPVLVGARDAWMVTDFLKENRISVILDNIHRLPSAGHEALDQPFRLPAILKEAGVDFCLSLGGSWEVRNLPFVAGTATAYGLSKEEALQAVTSNTARILNIADHTGKLAVNMDATLLISTGDILDMKTSIIEKAWIQGEEVDLENLHTKLYEQYRK